MLQCAVGEAASGGTHVGHDLAAQMEAKGTQRGLQFKPPTADVGGPGFGPQFSLWINQHARCGGHLPIHQHLTGHHPPYGLIAVRA